MTYSIPWNALIGGMLLGLSCGILLLFSGKLAGISGAISGLLTPRKGETGWRLTLLTGMVLSLFIVQPFGLTLPQLADKNLAIVAIAGLLVGFGSRLGEGCTSGHGIIGMGRLSKRSITATFIFMFTAIATVFLKRQLGVA